MLTKKITIYLITILCFSFGLSATPLAPGETAFQEGLDFISHYENSHGHLLRYTHFETPSNDPIGSVVFLQGRSTFLEFYEVLVVPLLDRGFDVWMYDLSGQGGSSRLIHAGFHDEFTAHQIQHVDSFDLYIEDAEEFINHVVLPDSKGMLILGGYSTGGHIALRYLQKNQENHFDAAFMISPLLALKAPIANKAMSYILWGASLFMTMDSYSPNASNEDPIFHLNFDGNVYTSSSEEFQKMKTLCVKYKHLLMGGVSLGWLKAAIDSIEWLWVSKSIKGIRAPVLIATGGDDQLIETCYNEEFVRRLPNGTHVYYPKGRHEIFRETTDIQTQWWNDFDTFIESNSPFVLQ